MASCDVVVSDILAYDAGCWQEFLAGKTLRLNSYHCTEGIPKADSTAIGTNSLLVACERPLYNPAGPPAPPATRPLQQPDRVDVFSRFSSGVRTAEQPGTGPEQADT